MNLKFSELIDSIDKELSMKYQGGAIMWVDNNFDMAWSDAFEEFDDVLSKCVEKNNYTEAEEAAKKYKEFCLEHIKKYKDHIALVDVDLFSQITRDRI